MRLGCLAAVAAIVLSVVTLGGILMWNWAGTDDRPPAQSGQPSVSSSIPATSAPPATATVTVYVTQPNTPTVSATGGGGNGAAWLAALGAIIAGLGTVASGAAAMATVRRDAQRGGRRIHRRTGGQGHRSRR
ncbi:hypothetical protein [Actinomadura alba]|uniref:Uncharacterized protein n=1 Tax=Actinomadura alba TaxID=406431 RepID=A0ABR7M3F0_9ACTN|nr:hypothetical protein [Actinomadura alba]MBC6471222.1 hypothetical protein [Actinomadura alba]